MNLEFLQWFGLGIAFWSTLNLIIDYFLERHEFKKRMDFEEKVDRYRRGRE